MTNRPFEALINEIADQENVPFAAAQALVDTENIKRDPNAYLKEAWGGGSYGLSMVTLATAREMGFKDDPRRLFDPRANVTYGLRYYRRAFDRWAGRDWIRARVAYNAGPDMSPENKADTERFTRHFQKWRDRYHPPGGPPVNFPLPPPQGPRRTAPAASRAGIGGILLAIMILGVLLPAAAGKGWR
jgi:soluble lytic murein transglycosylase-like protein